MKILAVVDGKPASVMALKTAVELAERLRAELGVISVRSGTHAMEEPAPVGVDIPAGERPTLPPGIRNLLEAADVLAASGVLAPLKTIKLRDVPHGHLFFGLRTNGERMLFCERFGGLVAELNEEIAVKMGRGARPDLVIGICGEHGGQPEAIRFCHDAGLDYVSCSAPRVPIARLAAAQAALRGRG